MIISQEAFTNFLVSHESPCLNLQLENSNISCLLHLLVQEDPSVMEDGNTGRRARFILFDEFVELIKTYMKKEQILAQSEQAGTNYNILGKESVEFLFQIRSALMTSAN